MVRAISLAILLHKYKGKATTHSKHQAIRISPLSSYLSNTAYLKARLNELISAPRMLLRKGLLAPFSALHFLPYPITQLNEEMLRLGQTGLVSRLMCSLLPTG